jgi:hypothetical protein
MIALFQRALLRVTCISVHRYALCISLFAKRLPELALVIRAGPLFLRRESLLRGKTRVRRGRSHDRNRANELAFGHISLLFAIIR